MCALLVAFALQLTLFTSTATSQNPSNLSVTIDSGPIVGRVIQHPDSATPVKQFLGIPFARPPIDDLRFLPPELPQPWIEVYNATGQPMACIQYSGPEGPARDLGKLLFNTPGPPGESEDCLYLNVYVPEGGVDDKAVLFWIYGGSNRAGAASEPLYDGTSFAANHDLIVVAINYRLNGQLLLETRGACG